MLEIAGAGRTDGLGITVVTGLVEGGSAEGCGVLAGDSISQVSIRRSSQKEEETQPIAAVITECLGYDATVNAIIGLPAQEYDDEVVVLNVKRIRMRPKVSIKLQYPPDQGVPDTTIEVYSGEKLRQAMLTRGIKLNDAYATRFDSGGAGDCGAEGTCATCAVNVVKGAQLLNKPGVQEKQILANNPRWRFACKAIVGVSKQSGEMIIQVNPRQW